MNMPHLIVHPGKQGMPNMSQRSVMSAMKTCKVRLCSMIWFIACAYAAFVAFCTCYSEGMSQESQLLHNTT